MPFEQDSPTTDRPAPSGFGLILVGNEILDGRVEDRHGAACRELLSRRNMLLRYLLILPDDPGVLTPHLRWALTEQTPFFCCGGIGSTPDDYTRACAAEAAGVPLEYHPEGLAIIRERFESGATPARMNLVRFPKGATLIPNPVNRIPGFTLQQGHFLPGFPEMAHPMMEWVLEVYYRAGAKRVRRALTIPGAREGDLVPLMEAFVADHPAVTFFSLPRLVNGGTEVTLGVQADEAVAALAWKDLKRRLSSAGYVYREESLH